MEGGVEEVGDGFLLSGVWIQELKMAWQVS